MKALETTFDQLFLPFAIRYLHIPILFTIAYSCLKFARQNTCMNAELHLINYYMPKLLIPAHHPSLFTNCILVALGAYDVLCLAVVLKVYGKLFMPKDRFLTCLLDIFYSRALAAHLTTYAALVIILMN